MAHNRWLVAGEPPGAVPEVRRYGLDPESDDPVIAARPGVRVERVALPGPSLRADGAAEARRQRSDHGPGWDRTSDLGIKSVVESLGSLRIKTVDRAAEANQFVPFRVFWGRLVDLRLTRDLASSGNSESSSAPFHGLESSTRPPPSSHEPESAGKRGSHWARSPARTKTSPWSRRAPCTKASNSVSVIAPQSSSCLALSISAAGPPPLPATERM